MSAAIPSAARNRARLRQSRGELTRVQAELGAWLTLRRNRDPQRKHDTQLNVLEQMLNRALSALGDELGKIQPADASGSVYARCRSLDARLTWVQRVWLYYREKFDQRDDQDTLGPVLAAADEVLWSCYAPCFRNVGRQPLSAPLTYIEPMFSAQAIPRDDPPPELRSSLLGPFQKEFLAQLPVPVIGLPPVCVEAPWWLVLLAHEAGHHVQYDLVARRGLIEEFGSRLDETVQTTSNPPEASERAGRWRDRSQEVFADAFSVVCTGTAAVRAMTELEQGTDKELGNDDKAAYPAPLVRLALLAADAGVEPLKLTADGALSDEVRVLLGAVRGAQNPPPSTVGVALDLGLVETIAQAALKHTVLTKPGLAAIVGCVPADFAPGGKVDRWTNDLLAADDRILQPPQDIRSARLLVSSAVQAWARLVAQDDEAKLSAGLARMRKRLLAAIEAGREPGTRAAAPTIQTTTPAADWFTERLLQTPTEALRS